MDSAVKVCLFSIVIGFASAQIPADCAFVDEFCDPTKSTNTKFNLPEGTTIPDAIDECYSSCNLDVTCLVFTVKQTGARPPVCYMLTEACVLNSVDACLSSVPPSCASGPSDCADYTPPTCDPVVPQEGDYALWQCQDSNRDEINPYNEPPPEGTVCYQTCASWVNKDGIAGPPGQLVSTCEGGAWSPTLNVDPTATDGALFYPVFPNDGTTYPTPDALAGEGLPCGCQPLHVQWLYGAEDGFYYDPNAEEAAEFICEKTVDMTNNNYIIDTTNTCVLYCDDHYVATATCLDGEWSGRPDWGFWCYEEPIAIA